MTRPRLIIAGGNFAGLRVCLAALSHRLMALANSVMPTSLAQPRSSPTGLACFAAAEQAGIHEPAVTGGGRASAQGVRFQGGNIYLGNLKSALTGTYRAFKFAKYDPATSPSSSSGSTGAKTFATY